MLLQSSDASLFKSLVGINATIAEKVKWKLSVIKVGMYTYSRSEVSNGSTIIMKNSPTKWIEQK